MKRVTYRLWTLLLLLLASCGLTAPPSEAQAPSSEPAEIDLTEPASDGENGNEGEQAAPLKLMGATPAGGSQATSEQIPILDHNPVWGSPIAPVTIVAFSDYQCPFCGRVQPTLQRLKEKYGSRQLRIVYKHHPLPFHKEAIPAAVAAQAVHRLGGDRAFIEFSAKLYSNYRQLDTDTLLRHARDVGVSPEGVFALMTSQDVVDEVEADLQLAKDLDLSGTPAFLINGVELGGAQPYEKFATIVESELEATRDLQGKGVPSMAIYAERVAENLEPSPPAGAVALAPPSPPPVDKTVWKVPVGKSPVLGPKHAPVTIVVFSDFECPFCKRVQPTLEALRQKYPKELRLVFKHNALPFHKRARPAAGLAIEAFKQRSHKGFWKAHDRLFELQPNLDEADLLALGKELQLNAWRVKQAVVKGSHDKLIDVDMDLADDVKARGTPHFFVNGRRISGAQPYADFEKLVEEELKKANAAIAGGTPAWRYYSDLMKTAKSAPPPEKKTVSAPTAKNPTKGPAKAPVTIQIFADFQCPFCSRVNPTLEQLKKRFGFRVRFVWRDLPLPFHKQAELAAEAAHEAFRQKGNKGFWKFHDEVFANQKSLDRQTLERIASQQGLNMSQFSEALDTHRHRATVRAEKAAADAAGIRGTPGFLINDYFVSGAQPFSKFKKVVNLALKDKGLPQVR